MSANCWPPQHPGWNPRMSISISNTKGLLNAPGENNCFLNSAVQVLWHLDVFRRSFRMMSGHACMGNSCIFCALKVIFTQFQFSDNAALPSDSLRKALAKTFADQQRFQLGLMDDAAECFEKMLLRIHFHLAHPHSEDACTAQHCIPHRKFGMSITEQIICECGAASEPFSFTQMVHYVSTSTLVSQLQQTKSPCNFGSVLRLASSDGSELKTCPGNCGRQNVHVRRSLTNSPEVVSVGLIWDSDHPSLTHINDVLRAIGTSLSLAQLYHSVPDPHKADACPLQLVGVVCYYGKHYSTFFFHSKTNTWLSFDDANVQELDPYWESVVEKCSQGHYQPLLLLFADPNSVPVSTETAHQNTFILDSSQYTGASLASAQPNISHQRQRSFDRLSDGSGTIGGRGATQAQRHLVPQMPEPATKNARRATTPNPTKMADRSLSVSRRSVTPNPEWTMCHSDEEDERKKPGHNRQPSYLHAFDAGHRRTSAPLYNCPISRGDSYSGTNNSGLMTRSQCSDSVAIDLSGPVPKAAEYHRYHNEMQRPNNANHPHAGSAFAQLQPHRVRTHSLGQELDSDCPPLQRSTGDADPRAQYGRPMVQDQDNYGTYISRKAVQSILQHQGVQRSAAPVKDLNVEIPDNSSLNSNQESGYRSGNSASSTASSLESPNDASRGVQGSQSQKLTHIPEGMASSYVTERSQIGKPQVCSSKPAVPLKPSISQPVLKPSSNDSDVVEKLYMEAESLMELANDKQEQGDVSIALLHCNKSIGLLQQALAVPNTCQESLVRIRMKQNACAMRSRTLQKQLSSTQRQMSNQSNMSSDVGIDSDHISISSTDTESNAHPKMYTKQDSGYGGYSTDSTDCQYNVRKAAQAYNGRASSNAYAGISRSVTDSQISKRQRQDSVDRLSKDIDAVDTSQSIDHFATLPRKGKGKTKAKPNASKEAEVYQAYLQRQRSCDDTVSDHAKQGLEQTRQWSKDEIRQMLVKDYYERRPKEQGVPPPAPPQEEAVRGVVNRSNSNLSYEEMIQRQMQSMALKEREAAYRPPHGQVRVMPQTPYQMQPTDFSIGQRNDHTRKLNSNNQLSAHVEALKLVGSSEVALAPIDPCPTSFATEINEPDTGSNSSTLNSQDDAFPPPPPPEHLLVPPTPPQMTFEDDDLPPPPYPGLSGDAPPPNSNGIETIKVSPVWTSLPCRCLHRDSDKRKPCSKCKVSRQGSNSSTSSWGSASSPIKPRVPPKLKTFQQLDSGISSGSCSHAPDSPPSHPRSRSKTLKHHKHRLRSRTCSPKSSRIPETPEPKPALSKKKKKGRKARKSVTFSENIALISTPEDKPPEIDYVKYVMENFPSRKADRSNSFSSTSTNADCDTMSVTRSEGESSRSSTDLSSSTKSSGQGQGYDSDLEVNSCSEGEDTDIEEPTEDIVNKMRCGLCRKKWVDRRLQYCEACGSYMSQFQPLKT